MSEEPSQLKIDINLECAVVVAASAGGLEALSVFLKGLPADLPAVVLVVQHLERSRSSMMADILNRSSKLPVRQAQEKERLRAGMVLIAPPNYHMLVSEGIISLTQTALVHFVRPSADLLFESAARSYQSRLIAVVLTGIGHDGSQGIEIPTTIWKAGSQTICPILKRGNSPN